MKIKSKSEAIAAIKQAENTFNAFEVKGIDACMMIANTYMTLEKVIEYINENITEEIPEDDPKANGGDKT